MRYKCFQRPWSGEVFHINYDWLSSYIFHLTEGTKNTHWEMYVMYLIFSKRLTNLSRKLSLIRITSQKIRAPYTNIVSAGVMSYCKSGGPVIMIQIIARSKRTSLHQYTIFCFTKIVRQLLMWSWSKHAVDSVYIFHHIATEFFGYENKAVTSVNN